MNIVLACDNNFAPYCATVIASVASHDQGVAFFLLTDNLNKNNAEKLTSMTSQMGSKLTIIYVEKNLFSDFPMPTGTGLSHISLATYFRLFMPLLLPQSIDKLIYLDCDIVVCRSIQELYDTKLEKYYLGAVYHNDQLSINNKAFERLNIPQNQGYFNAGVLLVNLKKWREDHIYERCIDFLKQHQDKILNHDQDILNVVCGKKTLMLSYRWNTMNYFFMVNFKYSKDRIAQLYSKESTSNLSAPTIIHFASRPKPWEKICVHPFASVFYKYLKTTPYSSVNKKKNNIKELWNFVLKPNLLGYLRYSHIKVGWLLYIGWLPLLSKYKK